jgi:hypothetical protein
MIYDVSIYRLDLAGGLHCPLVGTTPPSAYGGGKCGLSEI